MSKNFSGVAGSAFSFQLDHLYGKFPKEPGTLPLSYPCWVVPLQALTHLASGGVYRWYCVRAQKMIEDEKVKAVQEIAKFGRVTLETAQKLCSFLVHIFGTVPEDVIGVLGGDWLRHVRIRNFAKLSQLTEEILRERGILESTEAVSPSIALPILEGAQAETREELQELWARLLANAMDPERSDSVRLEIISAIKEFNPLDALVLKSIEDLPEGPEGWKHAEELPSVLGYSIDEIEVSYQNLERLTCINRERAAPEAGRRKTALVGYSFFGRELLRACKP